MLKTSKWLLLWNFVLTLDSFAHSDGVPRISLGNGTIIPYFGTVTIKHGNSLQLFCSGDVQNLKMFKAFFNELRTVTINETTVRYLEEKPELGIINYSCEDTKTNKKTIVQVFVDTPPLVTGFRCKSKNLVYLNCTWESENTFIHEITLYYIKDEPSHIFVICKLKSHVSMYCLWDTKHPSVPYQIHQETLTFLLEACNGLGCGNQTFVVNHFSIIQPDPPKLILLEKDSQHATIKSETPWDIWFINVLTVELRVSYTYFGIHQVKVNTSGLEDISHYSSTLKFKVQLELPCAQTLYEVRVSIKPEQAAGDEFWSEDAAITFTTDAEADEVGVAANPMCVKPRVTITPDIMMYKIEEFTDKFKAEQKEIKEKIASMKKKIGDEL